MLQRNSYTKAELKIRDKAIQEKHDKELAASEAKYQRLRHAYDQQSTEIFELQKRDDDIAARLGFRNLSEVGIFIDLADDNTTFRHLAERTDTLSSELSIQRRRHRDLQDELAEVTEERNSLKAVLAEQSLKKSDSTAQALAQDLVDLRARLNAVTSRAARADDAFKARYAKWQGFKQWMQDEEKEFKSKIQGIKSAQRVEQRTAYYERRGGKLTELGLNDDMIVDESAPDAVIDADTTLVAETSAVKDTAKMAAEPLQDGIDLSQTQYDTQISPQEAPDNTPAVSAHASPPPRPQSITEPPRKRGSIPEAAEERERKKPRLSSPVRRPLVSVSPKRPHGSPRKKKAAGRENRQLASPERRGKQDQTIEDRATINSAYAINPARNGGLDFQYDEVVRGKEKRKQLHGGDCECCRDYYEAIGPLPTRLQAPLWRTPPSSPQKPDRACRNDGHARDTISSHKQAISRHRHNWARTNTPPDYWTIGFPSTQETEDINRRAAEMHKEKRRAIEQEAARGGRYYKI